MTRFWLTPTFTFLETEQTLEIDSFLTRRPSSSLFIYRKRQAQHSAASSAYTSPPGLPLTGSDTTKPSATTTSDTQTPKSSNDASTASTHYRQIHKSRFGSSQPTRALPFPITFRDHHPPSPCSETPSIESFRLGDTSDRSTPSIPRSSPSPLAQNKSIHTLLTMLKHDISVWYKDDSSTPLPVHAPQNHSTELSSESKTTSISSD
jgi:hypothetical protein